MRLHGFKGGAVAPDGRCSCSGPKSFDGSARKACARVLTTSHHFHMGFTALEEWKSSPSAAASPFHHGEAVKARPSYSKDTMLSIFRIFQIWKFLRFLRFLRRVASLAMKPLLKPK